MQPPDKNVNKILYINILFIVYPGAKYEQDINKLKFLIYINKRNEATIAAPNVKII